MSPAQPDEGRLNQIKTGFILNMKHLLQFKLALIQEQFNLTY